MGLTPLYPYQIDGVSKIEEWDGKALLGDDMGLGKTIQVLNWIRNYLEKGPVIVVTPAHLKDNWKYEAWHHTRIHSDIAYGQKPPSKNEIRGILKKRENLVIIINYDILGYWLPFLMQLEPTCMVLDEAQMIKNRKAKRTKYVRRLSKVCKHRIAITGTPLMSYPAELWPILNVVRPDLYPDFFDFASQYCNLTRTPWGGWDYKGCKNPSQLNKELRTNCLIRRRKRQVLKDLPPLTRSVIPVEIKNKKEYDEANSDFLGWLKGINWNKADNATKMMGLAKAGYLKRLAAELKMDSIKAWIDDFLAASPYDKLLVGGIHKKLLLNPLYNHYRNQAVLVTGDVPSKKRHSIVDRFTKDKTCRIFFGNIHAAGTGWNGTAASTGLFIEFDWIPANHTQMEARLDRIGQKSPVHWYWMFARGTIEERMAKTLQARQGVVSSVLDGDAEIDKMPIYDQIIKSYGK